MKRNQNQALASMGEFATCHTISQGHKLLSAEEVDARLKLRYRGTSPKKRLVQNVNYYDHNILGLQNRLAVQENSGDVVPLFESVDCTAKRSRSQPAVFLSQDNIDFASRAANQDKPETTGRERRRKNAAKPYALWMFRLKSM